jgi:hypothetical protein
MIGSKFNSPWLVLLVLAILEWHLFGEAKNAIHVFFAAYNHAPGILIYSGTAAGASLFFISLIFLISGFFARFFPSAKKKRIAISIAYFGLFCMFFVSVPLVIMGASSFDLPLEENNYKLCRHPVYQARKSHTVAWVRDYSLCPPPSTSFVGTSVLTK